MTINPRDYTRGVKRTAKDFRRALRRALVHDAAGTAQHFERIFRDDVAAVLSQLATGYEAVNCVGLDRSDAKPAHLEQAFFLLHEALNLVVVAIRTLRDGSILASDGVLRQAFESAAVGNALAVDATGEVMRKFVGGRWRHADLTQAINASKANFEGDWVGRLYGHLTNSAAHPSLTHLSHSVPAGGEGYRIKVTSWFDPNDASRYKLALIRAEKTAIYVAATTEAAFLSLIEKPRFWTRTPRGPCWAKAVAIERRLSLMEDERRRIEEPFLTVYDWAEPHDREEVQRLLGAIEGDALSDIHRLRRAAETNPESFVARYMLAAAAEESGEFEVAVESFEVAWRLRPDGYDVWSRLERLYQCIGDPERLEQFYLRSIERNDTDYVAVHNLGMLLFDTGRYEDALARFRRAHELDASRYWAVHNGARALAAMKRFDEAIAAYHHAIERDPETPDPWHNIGVAHANLGQLNEAYRAFRRAVVLDAGYFASWVNLAGVCRLRSQRRRALACALRAEKLAPGDARIAKLLGELRAELAKGT